MTKTEKSRRQTRRTDKAAASSETPIITKSVELVAWLLDAMDKEEPRIPLYDEGFYAIADFRDAVIGGEAPDFTLLFRWDGLDNVRWFEMDCPDVLRHGLPLIHLVHRAAIGMAGDTCLDWDGVLRPEPIPLARMIDMIFIIQPAYRSFLRVRNRRPGRCLITTTKKGRIAFGGRVRVEMERIDLMLEEEVFDLSIPYEAEAGGD